MRRLLQLVLAGLAAGIFPAAEVACAADLVVEPGSIGLAAALLKAAPGDRLLLSGGVHRGRFIVAKPVTLTGEPGAVVDAEGEGTAIKILVPGVSVRGLTIRGSGVRGENFDAGVFVEQGADDVTLESNRIEGNLFGIVLHGSNRSMVRSNLIANRSDIWMNDRGNGIHIWNSTGSAILSNRVSGGRDGIFIEVSHGNVIRKNRFEQLRFAIHYMYANDNEVSNNVSIRNSVGFALMYSKRLKIFHNVSIADLQHGLMLHTTHKSEIAGNYIYGTGEKCLFVYTSASNQIRDNRFERCGVGVHFTGGSESNKFFGNSFVFNEFQVKYTGLRHYEWSHEGRGNFWSDNPAFDLDGDGMADAAYRPNTLIDWMLWRYPLAKLLVASPAVQTLRFVQEQLPTLYPGGAVDSHPLIAPPPPPVALPDGIDLTPAPRDPAQAGSDSRPVM